MLRPLHPTLKTPLLALLALSSSSPSLAQSIIAAPDSINTTIQYNGNTYNIVGGTQSGTNLFHSFTQLGLSPNEIANFLSNPDIANIIGRVTGGNPSIIQGLLSVTGGNSNLLLMNPAGMVFTQGASLNLPAGFTATTADSIGFLGGGTFSATGNINFNALAGAPTNFNFGSLSNGTIINAANLQINNGNLALIGSNIINTGSLSSSNGNITITAVPNSRSLRINQAGMVLGLEVAPESNTQITAADIPRLLNDPSLRSATGLEIGTNGEVRLVGGSHNIDAAGNVTLAGHVSGQKVYLGAANDVIPLDHAETLIRTHNGTTSAPTIARFPLNPSDPNRYIILDATVPQYNDLLFGGERGTTTVAIARSEDGIAKISELLNTPGLSKVDELHILSEGDTGNFWLGNAFVSSENIGQYQQQIQSWSSGLNVGASILLYACLAAAGAKGEALLKSLAAYSGANVAGSIDRTGLGGDWVLERSVGNVTATVPIEAGILANYLDSLAIFTVQNGDDAGTNSLRWAIGEANSIAGDDEIRFAPLVKLVTLTSGQLGINTSTGGLKIVGDFNSPGNVTVERSTTAPNFRIFYINGGGDVTIEALRIQNGSTPGGYDSGGGIFNSTAGTLTLGNSTVSDNRATYGGGILSWGAVTLNNSTVSNNTADMNSGGIYSYGALTITNSTVSNNRGKYSGGIVGDGGAVTLINSTVSGNRSQTGKGGGIYSNRSVTLTNSTVSGNVAVEDSGGGIATEGGGVTAINSFVTGNRADKNGGGIYTDRAANLTNSTISDNTAVQFGSGGVHVGQTLDMKNSTISGNIGQGLGGGLAAFGGGTIANSTIANNKIIDNFDSYGGGGIYAAGATPLTLQNSIVAGNFDTSSGNQYPDFFSDGGAINGNANNIIGYRNGASGTIGTGSDILLNSSDTSAIIGSLANNGGPTPTHAPIAGGAAVNGGNNAFAVGTDQRGLARIARGTVDIGAFEFQGYQAIASGTGQSTLVNTNFANPLSVQIVEIGSNRPLAGIPIVFSSPSNGASGILGNGVTVVTDASGVAVNPLSANDVAGRYQITAAVGSEPLAAFELTNIAPPLPSPPPSVSPDIAPPLPPTPPSVFLRINSPAIRTLTDSLNARLESNTKGVSTTTLEVPVSIDDLQALDRAMSAQFEAYIQSSETAGNSSSSTHRSASHDAQKDLSRAGEETEGGDTSGGAAPTARQFSIEEARSEMREVERLTFVKPAIIYATFEPMEGAEERSPSSAPANSGFQGIAKVNRESPRERLQLTIAVSSGQPKRYLLDVTREQVMEVVQKLQRAATDPQRRIAYLAPSEQLYQWLIAPLETELQSQQVSNLLFIVDRGLRSIPFAALHDGDRFIIEKYSVGLLPSLGLSNLHYTNLKNSSVLAMGASTFPDPEQEPLPAVPVELDVVGRELWTGDSYLNEQFNLSKFQQARASSPHAIVHLATHGDFQAGTPANSYIQLWDSKLTLDRLQDLGWSNPPVELLVLSACRTALGDEEAELGFAGLAVLAGVKTAVGGLWNVNDEGTLGLMAMFYEQMKVAPIKAEALRRAQLAMLRGEIRIKNGQLVTPGKTFPLPPEFLEKGERDFKHPYYWSGFAAIGSPF